MRPTSPRPCARRLLGERRATTALEFALVCPVFFLFVFGLFAIFSLVSARRAMDFGIERALRSATVNSAGGQSAAIAAFSSAAKTVWFDVGKNASVTVSPSVFAPGTPVTVTVTYAWSPMASVRAPGTSTLFPPVTLTASASVRSMN